MDIGETLERHSTGIARFAWWSAWFGLVAGQLHALSRFQTADGLADLELPLTAAWAEPAADALQPLLDWGDPDLVYVTYGKIWLPVFLGFFLCALLVAHRRQPRGFEAWAWRVAIVGYGWAVLGVAATYWTQWTTEYNAVFDVAFLAGLPGLVITLLGSSVLGVTLLVHRFRPLASAILLAAALPLALVISEITSLGNAVLPVSLAFAWCGLQALRDERHDRTNRSGMVVASAR